MLHIPSDDKSPVEIIHKSFSDFLLEDGGSDTNPFRVDILETHHMLARRCIKRLSNGLCKNTYKLDDLAMSKRDI